MNPRHLAMATSLGIGVFAALVLLGLLSGGTSQTAAAPECRSLRAPGDVITVCLSGGCDHPSVQDAVDAASDSDVIKVATGIYTVGQGQAGITPVVYISKSITIRGGYTTTNWGDSRPISYPTTLDAKGQGRVMVITDGAAVTIEGLHITGGDATGLDGDPACCPGGGIYAISATATISNNRVFSNVAYLGGGLFARNLASLTLAANKVYSNASATNGGGMLLAECANAMLASNEVYTNVADAEGGGLYLVRSHNAVLQDNHIYSNVVSASDGDGAGVFLFESTGVLFQGNRLWGNRCDEWGGGLLIHTSPSATVRGNAFYLNTAGLGGGIFVRTSTGISMAQNAVFSNTADRGGGIFLRASDAVLTNNFIVENDANGQGGGMAVDSGKLIIPTTGVLLHNTFAANGDNAIGVFPPTVTFTVTSTLRLTNTVICSHTVGIRVISPTAVVTAAHTLWCATATLTESLDGGSISTTVDHVSDPPFVGGEATADDMRAYHITHSSAARDKGEPAGVAADYDGDARPFGSLPDIGADEYPFGASTAYLAQATPCHITYTVFITNGRGTTVTMGMIYTLPLRLHYRGPTLCTPGTCGYQAASRTITWMGTAPPTSTAQVSYVLHADYPAATTTVVHTAWISTPLDRFETSRVTTTVRVQSPTGATEERSSHHPSPDGYATIGELLTYTLYFTLPQGTGVYTPTVVETLPRVVNLSDSPPATPALTYVVGSGGLPPTVAVSPDAGTVTWTLGTVTAPCGTSSVISVPFQAQVRNHPENNCADVLQNTAVLSYTDATDAVSLGVTSTHVITLQEPHAQFYSKTISPASGVRRGDILTVTLTFGNNGRDSQTPLYDVLLTDVLPTGLAYDGVVGDTPTPTVSGGVLTWTIAEMGPDSKLTDTFTFTVVVTDDAPLGETLTNTAEIWGSSLPGVQAGERDGDNAIGAAKPLYHATAECTVEVHWCIYLPFVLVGATVLFGKGKVKGKVKAWK